MLQLQFSSDQIILEYHQKISIECGTCHIASPLLPLPRAATSTICSPSSFLITAFTQHLASHPCSAPLLKLLRLYQVLSLRSHQLTKSAFLHLVSHPKILAHFYARIRLLARNTINTPSAPHRGCSTSHQD